MLTRLTTSHNTYFLLHSSYYQLVTTGQVAMDTEVTDTPITTVETVITTNDDIPGEPIGEMVEAETLTEVREEHKKIDVLWVDKREKISLRKYLQIVMVCIREIGEFVILIHILILWLELWLRNVSEIAIIWNESHSAHVYCIRNNMAWPWNDSIGYT